MKVKMEVSGLDKLTSLASRYPAIAEKHVNLAINRSLLRVLAAEKQEAPFGSSGGLRDRWTIEMGRFEGTLTSVSKYAAYVEAGTKPHMPPVDQIAPWAKKRGLNPWAVAMSIKKKGTKANPFFTRAIKDATAGVQQEMKDAISRITAELGASI